MDRIAPFRRLLLLFSASAAFCLTTGCESTLGVYTLCSYEDNWKGNVCVSPALDPYYDFWDAMTTVSNKHHADPDKSRRYQNSEVTLSNVIPAGGGKSWDDFDLVFFYGHNNTIVSPHPHEQFHYYNYENGGWVSKTGYLDDIGWGYTTNYDYYAVRPIHNANVHPGAVTYLYNKYTSSLIGGGYDYGGGAQWREHWNDPLKTAVYGKLGDNDLEWLILHGCQAVITANMDGSYNSLAYKTFSAAHGKFHIVLGHYKSYYTSQLQPLAGFAHDLMTGVPVQAAYFDVDPDRNTSAIAAEKPLSIWAKIMGQFDWSDSTMVNDKWTKPMPDNAGTNTFSMRWIVPVGTTASEWR